MGRMIGPKYGTELMQGFFFEPRCSRSCFHGCLGVVCLICMLNVCLVCFGPGMVVDFGFTK